MATRGLVIVVDDVGSWRGFELVADAGPAESGAQLIAALKTYGLAASAERIRGARLMPRMRDRAEPETHGTRGDLSWIYVVDPAARELRVFRHGLVASPNAPGLPGRWEEISKHAIGTDGTATPNTITFEERAPWPEIPVDDTWDPTEGLVLDRAATERFTDTEATARLETRRRFARAKGDAKKLEDLVHEMLFRKPWDGKPPERVYVTRRWTIGSKYWATPIGGSTLIYAPAGWGRDSIRSYDDDRETLTLFADGREVEVDIHRSAWPAGPLTAALKSAFVGPHWMFSVFDLVRAVRFPDLRGEALERMKQTPQDATDWAVYVHPDGRVWSIRPSTKGYQLRLGDPDDDPIFKDRAGSPETAVEEQLADGFIRR